MTSLQRLDDKTVVSGHPNGTIIVWSIEKQSYAHVFEKYHSQPICGLVRLSNDQFISYDGLTLKWWDLKQGEGLLGTKKCVKTVNEKNATALEILSNGLFVFASQGILKFYDTKNYKINKEIDTKYAKSPVTKIKELKDGTFVIGYGDGFLQIFDSKTEKFHPVQAVSDKQRSITALTILDDKHWVSGSRDGEVMVWDDNKICLSRFEANSAVTSLCIGSLGQVYIGCEDGTLHRWQPSLKTTVSIDDDTLLKPFKIDGSLVTITRDEDGRKEMIARGGGGKIYKGLYNNKLVAIKESFEEKDLVAEIKIMAQMHDYPTVLSFEGVVQEKNRFQLVMELMSQGSLSSFLKRSSNISWEERWVLMMDIVYGLLCLHANNIVHRDIKADNILINNKRAKICDFVVARKNINRLSPQVIGSIGYIDPWLDGSEDDRYTEKSDIYSLGNVLWELLNEQYQEPWDDIRRDYKQRLVDNNEKLKIPDKTPPILKDLLQRMWDKRRNKRPHISTVFEIVWKSREELQKNDLHFQSKTSIKKKDLKPPQTITKTSIEAQKTKVTLLSPSNVEMKLCSSVKIMDKLH